MEFQTFTKPSTTLQKVGEDSRLEKLLDATSDFSRLGEIYRPPTDRIVYDPQKQGGGREFKTLVISELRLSFECLLRLSRSDWNAYA